MLELIDSLDDALAIHTVETTAERIVQEQVQAEARKNAERGED